MAIADAGEEIADGVCQDDAFATHEETGVCKGEMGVENESGGDEDC